MKTLAILGGGFSGLMTAAQLLVRARKPLQVLLIERRPALGEGAAYGSADPSHLLNVPARNMGAWDEESDGFYRWCLEHPPAPGPLWAPPLGPDDFLPRSHFAAYLRDQLQAARSRAHPGVTLRRIQASVVSLEGGGPLTLRWEPDAAERADAAVLALGQAPPAAPAPISGGERCIRDPWAPGAFDGVGPSDSLLIAGAGLSMADVAVSLAERGRRGPVTVVSRRGLWPLAHPEAPVRPAPLPLDGPLRTRPLFRAFRRACGEESGDPLPLIDGLRASTPPLWRILPPSEKARFLRHVRPYWDRLRHRVPPRIGRSLEGLRAEGRLRLVAGRFKRINAGPNGVAALVAPRGGGMTMKLAADWLVLATGPAFERFMETDPLLRALSSEGLLRADPLGLGLDADADGRLLDAQGRPSPVLWTLGPLLRGRDWESTAVPELRVQAARLAQRLIESC